MSLVQPQMRYHVSAGVGNVLSLFLKVISDHRPRYNKPFQITGAEKLQSRVLFTRLESPLSL